jgi:cob(I)alamin adenosyltransferase
MSSRKEPGIRSRTPPPRPSVRPRSLVLVNTGDGKGKSTAAFGVVMRAVARDWRVCVIQFIKSDKWKVGEEKIGRQLGVDWLKGGDGFTWESPDLDQSQGRSAAAWQLAAADRRRRAPADCPRRDHVSHELGLDRRSDRH